MVNGLHDAALLVGAVAHPVHLARRDEQMRAPLAHMAVEDVALLDAEIARVLYAAALAVAQAVVAVDGRVGLGEEVQQRGLCAGTAAALAEHRRHERLERHGHLLLHRHALRGIDCHGEKERRRKRGG